MERLEILKRELTGSIRLEGEELEKRRIGLDWPQDALTMIGDIRMDNIRYCLETVINESIGGDFIECGVWRGGACIYAKAIIDEMKSNKKVFVADSFCGFPEPKFNWDKGANFLIDPILKVSEKEVKANFERYRYLDNNVIFVKGYFEETLPNLNGQFSVVRADGDLFESTIDILENLYSKLSVGGFLIIDDYGLECCRQAVIQYREKFSIIEPIIQIDSFGAYWRKER